MAFNPTPCATCGGGDTAGPGQPAFDAEQQLLCDIDAEGNVLGTALMVTLYDDGSGNPLGPPSPVNPATGDPYVVLGTLQPCPGGGGCGHPTQFCFQSTGQVDNPGRMYDTTLTLGQGFAVQGLVRDLVDTPLNITWEVTDPDASQFVTDLQTALQSQFAGQTVTVTPGVVDPCTGTADFAVHIECLRLDQNPPTLLQFRYNNGRDLVQNAAFNITPPSPTPAPLAYVKRADQAAPFAVADVNCTAVANRGWETNDKSNVFELWGPPGSIQNTIAGTTPTPRGTAVQEINAFGSGATPSTGFNAGNPAFGVDPDTLWQTFAVPAAGNFTIRVVVGARSSGAPDSIPLRVSTGDVGAVGIGDVINTTIIAGNVVTELGGAAGPWTTFSQTVPLAAGVYTIAFTGPDQQPATGDNAFGGLFTDMRVFQDAPNTIQAFTNDDATCTVESSETSTVCEFWAPRCSNGEIVGWYNVADGEDLSNAEFWAQVPAPTCCSSSSDGGQSSTGNLVYTYPVCATLNGETRTMSRVVVSDQAGGIIADTFVDTDGGPVTPDTWQPGECSAAFEDAVICYTTVGDPTPRQGFRREILGQSVTFLGDTGALMAPPAFWRAGPCPADPATAEVLCDDNGPFLRTWDRADDGTVAGFTDATLAGAPYVAVGAVGVCPVDVTLDCQNPEVLIGEFCYSDGGPIVRTGATFRACDGSIVDRDAVTGALLVAPIRIICPETFQTLLTVCDDTGPFLIQYVTVGGNVGSATLELDGVTPHVVVGDITTDCDPAASAVGRDVEIERLCDNNGPFLRVYQFGTDTGTPSGAPSDLTLAGAPYVTVGPVVACPATVTIAQSDVELQILCDATPTRFLRRYTYDAETPGVAITITDTTLDGTTPFVPVGAVGICSTPVVTDLDFVVIELCDNNGGFLRRFTFNSSTGLVTATTNTTLAGVAYVPVGTVGICDGCCPVVVGQGCTNTGSGRYVAIRNPAGVISLFDSVTGAAVLPAAVIPCVSDDTTITSTAELKLLAAAQTWTPGVDLVGTLTGITVQVLTGTATIVDATGATVAAALPAGTSVSWNVEDNNVLTGPASVTADAASTVLVNWTRR